MDTKRITKSEFLERYGHMQVKFHLYSNYNFIFHNYVDIATSGKRRRGAAEENRIFVSVGDGNQYIVGNVSIVGERWYEVRELNISSGIAVGENEIEWFEEGQVGKIDLSKYKEDAKLPYIREEE